MLSWTAMGQKLTYVGKESIERVFNMEDDKLPNVEALLKYMYYGDYDDQVDFDASPALETPMGDAVEVKPEPAIEEPEPPSPELVSYVGHDVWGRVTITQGPPLPPSKPSSLLFNSRMYILADKYMIPSLKSLAHEKLVQGLKLHWNDQVFTTVAETLWENTPDDDELVRDAITAAAAININILLDREEFVDFLEDHGDFAVEVMKKGRGAKGTGTTAAYPENGKKKKKGKRSSTYDWGEY